MWHTWAPGACSDGAAPIHRTGWPFVARGGRCLVAWCTGGHQSVSTFRMSAGPSEWRRMPKLNAIARLDTEKLNEMGQRLADQVLNVGIDGAGPIKGAREVAEEHLTTAGGDREQAIKKLVATHIRLAAVSGFVTGAGGLITLPVALPAALTGLYVTATRMAAGIAYLRGHDLRSEEVRSAILVCLLGSGASTALSKAGVEIGQKSALAALQRVPGRVLIEINKRIGFRLVTKAGEKGVINLTKLVPLVGAPIGATVDGVSCRAIATYARSTFEPIGLALTATTTVVDGEIVAE